MNKSKLFLIFALAAYIAVLALTDDRILRTGTWAILLAATAYQQYRLYKNHGWTTSTILLFVIPNALLALTLILTLVMP